MRKLVTLPIAISLLCLLPATVQAQAPSWTGLYVGGTVGARVTDADYRTTSIFALLPPPFTTTPDGTAARSFNETDFRFGAYAGAIWQFAPTWVIGAEMSIGTALDSSNPRIGIPGSPNAVPGFTANTIGDRLSVAGDWDAAIRARLGYLVSPATLLYVSGGVAFQDVVLRAQCGGNPAINACAVDNVETSRTLRTGWTVGGGIEQALGGNLFVRLDYAYADFARFSHLFFRGSYNLAGPYDDQFTGRVDVSTHTANLGLAYKF